ncbi:MAG: ABC transporter ATP-binding protein [Bacteroidaceae bacterium]|nr:ABC transporter ATP-binding protein [Bacteroidaceae bacterium]MBQ9171115.1 ABC transporter ATP-binding protein [Bacteroidaceae bacterium]MBQ9293794.1 ABC transporter ATP-binding protein [Bacteroidaceae bacterium]
MEIQLKELKKTFGEKVAVDIPELTIHSGDLLGLVGNNGAGKSTLFRLILDLIKADTGTVCMEWTPSNSPLKGENQYAKAIDSSPYKGEVERGSVNVAETEVWKDWTGAFVDESFLIDYLTPDEYFQFIARITDTSSEQLQAFLDEYQHFMADELVGQKKLIRTLSAGNKQKVGIMAAMLLKPQVLILDEPFNFLDPSSQNAIKHLLKKYNEETGATILVSSHNLQHTVDISHRIVLLEHGKVIHDIDNREKQAQDILENYFEIND